MRKFIFTLMLAIAGSVWTTTEAAVQLPSLCDEWHYVTYYAAGMDIPATPVYYSQHLAADTVIGEHKYRQLRGRVGYRYSSNDNYLGALREGDNADIYYVPADSTHEYLLYAFNANVGDTLKNLWMGTDMQCTTAIITEISTGQLRTFQAKVHVIESGHYFEDFWELWTDSVGSATSEGPAGVIVYMLNNPYLACACKDGRKIYVGDANCACDPPRLKSLCDTWNVLFVRMGANGDELSTEVHRLTTDTVINGKTYVQLYIYGDYGVRDRVTYRGALREDNNANVYIVPANSDHEYLLYAFNAKVGDKLSNLWIGGAAETGGLPDGLNATVADITESSPRLFTLYLNADGNMDVDDYKSIQWVEGVGLTDCPGGSICPGILGCACSCGHIMLCAYKDGELVYDNPAWDWCYYDSTEQPGDTVKLYRYVKDSPGSSTVDPVDPNQIVATLLNDVLTIREYTGEEITYSLKKSPAGTPFRHNEQAQTKLVREDTFRNTVSVTITEDGSYRLDLTNPEWGYGIYGTFDYGKSAIEPVVPEAVATAAAKILRNGQLLIRQGDRIFTPTGMQIE